MAAVAFRSASRQLVHLGKADHTTGGQYNQPRVYSMRSLRVDNSVKWHQPVCYLHGATPQILDTEEAIYQPECSATLYCRGGPEKQARA